MNKSRLGGGNKPGNTDNDDLARGVEVERLGRVELLDGGSGGEDGSSL
jgi:hypothetical protein